ncbi:MAG: class I SAM-dependent methyltransferase [Phycisphaerales bacterium]|nr:class I SAM-dependent methyltransferase [Phycisphaerales bacterium]
MFKHQSILPLSLLAGLILGSAATIATTSNAGPPGAPGLGTAATPATAPDPEPPRVVDSRETTQQREPVATEATVIFDLRSMQIDPNDFESLQRRTAITLPAFESKDPVQFELELLRQAVDGRASVEQHGVWIVIRGSKAGIREARRIRAAVADFVSPPVTLQCTVIQLPLSDPNSATLLAEWRTTPITPEGLDRLGDESAVTQILAQPTVTTRVGRSASIRIDTENQEDIELRLKPVRLQDGELDVEIFFDSANEVTLGRRHERRGVRAEETVRLPDGGVGLVFGQPFATAEVRELDGGTRVIDRSAPTDQDHMMVVVRRVPTVGTALEEDPIYGSCEPTRDGTGRTYFDREIAQVMGHLAAGWLERPKREREERTDLLVRMLELRPGMDVADIGAGSGYFTRRMSPSIEPDGTIFATDIQPEMLEYLDKSLLLEGIQNVVPILGRVDDTGLAQDSVDLILLVDVYHEFDHPWEMARSMHRALRPGGRIALVEYRAGDATVPIKPLHTMTEAQARLEFEAAGFEMVESLVDGLPWQRLMIFKPKADVTPSRVRPTILD